MHRSSLPGSHCARFAYLFQTSSHPDILYCTGRSCTPWVLSFNYLNCATIACLYRKTENSVFNRALRPVSIIHLSHLKPSRSSNFRRSPKVIHKHSIENLSAADLTCDHQPVNITTVI